MPVRPPPEMPSNMPPAVADYLRRLRSWAAEELERKVDKAEAAPQLLLLPSDQKNPTKAFKVVVDSAGSLSAVSVPIGAGFP